MSETIAEAGIYQMDFHVDMINIGGTAVAEAVLFVEEDAGSSYAPVPAFAASISVPSGANRKNGGGCAAVLCVGANYRHRVKVARASAPDSLATDGSLLNVVRLFKLR